MAAETNRIMMNMSSSLEQLQVESSQLLDHRLWSDQSAMCCQRN